MNSSASPSSPGSPSASMSPAMSPAGSPAGSPIASPSAAVGTAGQALASAAPTAGGTHEAAWRRDLRAIVDGLRGVTAPSFSRRTPRRSDVKLAEARLKGGGSDGEAVGGSGALRLLKPRPLVVTRLLRETKDALTVVLRDPSGAAIPFSAGQFLTLLVTLPGQDGPPLRRAYSICTPPLDAQGQPAREVAITCKRVVSGRVSNYLNDELREGATLSVLGPSGSFTPEPRADRARQLVLLGGGSGITPLLSIVHSVLHSEPQSCITLIYGNRRREDILFHDVLADLAAAQPTRLRLRHVLSEPPADWTQGTGLLDRRTLLSELSALSLLPTAVQVDSSMPPPLPREYYLCGPAPMMDAARQVLTAAGVPPTQIWEERFASLHDALGTQAPATKPVRLELSLRRLGSPAGASPEGSQSAVVQPGETLLEAGLAAGAELPFSCAMGGCGACKGKLLHGQVHMPEPNCLTAAERAQGYVLPCIAKPCGDVAVAIER